VPPPNPASQQSLLAARFLAVGFACTIALLQSPPRSARSRWRLCARRVPARSAPRRTIGFAQSRLSGCLGPRDRFDPSAASRRAIALATIRSRRLELSGREGRDGFRPRAGAPRLSDADARGGAWALPQLLRAAPSRVELAGLRWPPRPPTRPSSRSARHLARRPGPDAITCARSRRPGTRGAVKFPRRL
jgi:hypothetical protein